MPSDLHHDTPMLRTARLSLEALAPRHAAALADYLARNEARFRPTAPPREKGTGTLAHAAELIKRSMAGWRDDRLLRFAMLMRADAQCLIGRVNFTDISRGPFQGARLGYDIDGEFEGRGLMSEALAAGIDFMFRETRLHRVEANHLPGNLRSERVLTKLGFESIGIARNYLFIDGAWRDHVLNQKINPYFDPAWLVASGAKDRPATPR